MTRKQEVMCLEGDWDECGKMRSKLTMEDVLRVLSGAKEIGGYVHRDVATAEELGYYLHRLRSLDGFSVLYLAFHGSGNGLSVNDDAEVLWHDLETMAEGSLTGTAVHFGSCRGLATRSSREWRDFCRLTGAASVSGYERDVDWLPSAMLDMAVLSELAGAPASKRTFSKLRGQHPNLVDTLGLRMINRRWDSAER